MKRFRNFYILNLLFGILWFGACYALFSYASLKEGWVYVFILGSVMFPIFVYLSRFYDIYRFAWHVETKNRNLKERLVSLIELKDVKHKSIERLNEEVSRERMVFVPITNRFMLIPFIFSLSVFLLSFINLPTKPKIKFIPAYSKMFVGDTLVIETEPKVERIFIKGLEKEIRGDGRFLITGLDPGKYEIYAKGYEGKGRIDVISRPLIYKIEGFIVPPKYTGLSPRPLGKDNVAYEGSVFKDLKIKHNGDSAIFLNLPTVIKNDVNVKVKVFKDGRSFTYEGFSVKVIKDMPPTVSINPSGIYKVQSDELVVVVSAYDDVRLKKVGFKVIEDGKVWNEEKTTEYPNLSFDVAFKVNDTLKVFAYAEDVSGKFSISDTLIILPKDPIEDFKEKLLSLDRIGSLEKRLKDIEEQLKATEKLSYETKQEITAATKSVRETYDEIRESLERLANELNDPEISSLINEVRRMMREVMDEELSKRLEELNKALEKADPEKIAEALKNLRISQRELKEQLTRFKKLLERFEQERELQRLSERLTELSKKQQDIVGKRDSLAQKEISNEIDSIMRKLEDYAKLEDIDKETLKKLKETLSSAKELSENSLSGMRSGKNFARQQAKIALKLSEASKLAEDLYNSLVQNRMEEITSELNNIGDISTFLNNRINEDPDMKDIDRAKSVMLDVRDKLKELSEKNVFVSPKLKEIAEDVYKNLDKAHSSMAKGDKDNAKGSLKEASEGLMKLSMMTQSAAQACQNAGGSTGMATFLRQLSRMAGEQGSISQNLIPGLSEEELAELAARQMALNQALRGLIDNMNRMGMPGDILRELENTLKSMEELERELKDPQSITKLEKLRKEAERIKIRLLEAREALRKQRTEPVYEAQRPKPYKINDLRTRKVVDRRVIYEIYTKTLTERQISPQERRIYEEYIKEFLR